MIIVWAHRALHLVAVLAAWALARRGRVEHRPLAVAFAVLLAIDIAEAALVPWRAARWCWAVSAAGFVAWYAVGAWAVWRGLAPSNESKKGDIEAQNRNLRKSASSADYLRSMAFAALALPVALFLAAPVLRPLSERLYLGAFLAALAVQLLAATRYVLRWRAPTATEGTALFFCILTLGDLAGVWLSGSPVRNWPAQPWINAFSWAATGGLQAWIVAHSSRTSAPPSG